MKTQTFKNLPSAYTLHYHLVCQTKFNRKVFQDQSVLRVLNDGLSQVCERKKYHLIGSHTEPDKLYTLMSLRPDHDIAKMTNAIKANTARSLNHEFPELAASLKDRSLWAIGYFVRSIGKASRPAAQSYIDNQAIHHGLRSKRVAEIMRWVNPQTCTLRATHADFDLSYHVVIVSARRAEVFDAEIAPRLFSRIAAYASSEGFYLERASLQADHLHILLKTTPTIGISTCVEGLMNDSLAFMNERYWGVLKATNAPELWTPSYYVGTVGDRTTAQIKGFLGQPLGLSRP